MTYRKSNKLLEPPYGAKVKNPGKGIRIPFPGSIYAVKNPQKIFDYLY